MKVKLHWKYLVILVGLASFIIGFTIAILTIELLQQSQKTIYDKLNEAKIDFQYANWYVHKLKMAESIGQIKNFEAFRQIYEEKNDPRFSLATWEIYVFIDSTWNVLWLEVTDSATEQIDYIGFYFYSEPD